MTDDEQSVEDDLRIVIQQVARGIRNNRGDEHMGDTQLAVLMHLNLQGPLGPSVFRRRAVAISSRMTSRRRRPSTLFGSESSTTFQYTDAACLGSEPVT